MKKFTADHWIQVTQVRVRGRVRRRMEGAVGDTNSLRRPKVSSNPDNLKFAETNPSPKEHTWDGA